MQLQDKIQNTNRHVETRRRFYIKLMHRLIQSETRFSKQNAH